ncbi:MAG: hypothetical protein MOGMAGMI_01844 [Candidatus Omnitrophica bacterium]|nr:hypothetical protein [Candidatus Omnitrophota bacterium]
MLTGADGSATITANSSGNSRIDAVVLYIDRAASPNAACSNVAKLIVIAGTPAASPVAPTNAEIASSIGASNPYLRLADVTVASGATSISDANIKDRRVAAIYSTNVTPNASFLYRNAIVNSCFDVAQLGTTFTSATTPANNDDTYLLDMWNLISDGNDAVDVSQESSEVPEGATYSLKLDVETSKRFGIVQFLEFVDAKKFKGKRVSISFAVKSANIAAIRAAVLSWGSTADSITSDIVSSWAATPTWAANWTAENTPEDLTVTSDWSIVKIENIYIDSATVNNLALAIWLPNEETVTDVIYISKVQMNEGEYAFDHQARPFIDEVRLCERFFEKSHNMSIAPATATSAGAEMFSMGTNSANYVRQKVVFKTRKRSAPTIAVYDHAGTSSRMTGVLQNTSEVDGVNTHAIEGQGDTGFYFWFNKASTYSGCSFEYTADSRL